MAGGDVVEVFKAVGDEIKDDIKPYTDRIRSFDALLAALQYLGVEVSTEVEYDMCKGCGFLFRCSYQLLLACPCCETDRYEPGTLIPYQRIKYRPLYDCLKRAFRNAKFAKAVTHHASDNKNLGNPNDATCLVDIYNGKVWSEEMLKDPRYARQSG
jgi:hypothetical protein